MREMGYKEDEIDAKLPLEPVEQSGFKFGAVMGKRLVDYGIMSSSSDSDEDEILLAQPSPANQPSREIELSSIDEARR